jgi:hypothetical protein
LHAAPHAHTLIACTYIAAKKMLTVLREKTRAYTKFGECWILWYLHNTSVNADLSILYQNQLLSSCSRLYGRESRVDGDVIVALPPASITLSSIPRYKSQLASTVSTLRLKCVQLALLAYAIFHTCRIDQGATHVMSSDTSSLPKLFL